MLPSVTVAFLLLSTTNAASLQARPTRVTARACRTWLCTDLRKGPKHQPLSRTDYPPAGQAVDGLTWQGGHVSEIPKEIPYYAWTLPGPCHPYTAMMHPVTKRDNTYGDEPVLPATEASLAEGTPETPEEEAGSTVEQAAPAEQPSVESSGYRRKRDNSYGDEPITPAAAAAPETGSGYDQAEETPAPVEQPTPAASYPVESSGYRKKKRSNEYGDEPVAPQEAPAPAGGAYEAPEQAPAPVEQPTPEPSAVESSGY